MQAERDTNGAIIQHWKPSDIEKVVIPIIDMEQQEKIAIKIKESFSLRKKSNELLDWAKRAVEIAIEQNEVAPLVRTGGSRHTGLAALPHRNIHIRPGNALEHVSYS